MRPAVDYRVIFTFLAILIGGSAIAQTRPPLNLSRETGLSNNSVTDIEQDSFGYIWIATKNGINRYDGFSVTIFNRNNSRLKSTDFTELLVATDGSLFAANANGELYRFDYIREDFYEIGLTHLWSAESKPIVRLSEPVPGTILIGTTSGLMQMNTDSDSVSWIQSTKSRSLNIKEIRVVGDVTWLATQGDGLLTLQNGKLEAVTSVHNDIPAYVNTILVNDKEVLIGTNGSGLHRFDRKSRALTPVTRMPDVLTVRDISSIGDRLLIATEGAGVIYSGEKDLSDAGQFHPVLSDRTATRIFFDNQENVWIGTAWDGVFVIPENDANIQYMGFDRHSVLSMYMSPDVNLVGTDGDGLWRSDRGAAYKKVQLDGVKYINFIHKSGNGDFWIGTFLNGLIGYSINTGVQSNFNTTSARKQRISFGDVRDVIELDNGDMYIATWGGGVNHYTRSSDSIRVLPGSLFGRDIEARNIVDLLLQDDRIYIATFGDGLLYIDLKTKKYGRVSPHAPQNTDVLNLYALQAKGDEVWIGTWADGIAYYNPHNDSIRYFAEEETLGRRSIRSIEQDREGNLWFATEDGIIKYAEDIDAFQSYAQLKGEYRKASSFVDSNGTLYFGGPRNIVNFQPSDIQQKRDSVDLIFTDLQVYGRSVAELDNLITAPVPLASEVNLGFDQRVITFHYSALEYPRNETIQYQVRLLGVEEDWRFVGNQKTVTYSSLPTGSHVFEVEALRDGITVAKKTLRLNVAKPPWATWWAYSLYALAGVIVLLLIVFFSIKWEKMRSSLKIEKVTHEKDLELMDTKQRFFTHISHEIRTPVTIILSAINRVTNENHRPDGNGDEHMRAIKNNGNHLLKLVNEMLDYQKLDEGKVKLSMQQVDIEAFVQEIFISMRPKFLETDIQSAIEIDLLGKFVWCDPFQLEKAITNLLANAARYAGESGSVRLKLVEDDQNIFISIIDSGPGIPPELTDKIFAPFFQVKPEDGQGFGIGLSVVKDIVTLHEGEIDVRSEQGVGTTFTIKLPRGTFNQSTPGYDYVADADVPVPASNDAAEDGVANTILIVEDNEQLRKYIQSVFASKFHVLEAADGEQALAVARKETPDIIISDVLMPLRNGIELVQELKKDILTCHIPVILLTARAGLIFKKEGFDVGADDYISKPFNEHLLFARVKNLLASRAALWNKYKWDTNVSHEKISVENQNDKFISDLKNIVMKNLKTGEISSDFLAREMGMSHSVIYKKLKQLTGLSLVEFVREYKLNIAAELLRVHNYTVQETCHHAGFPDRRYFSRVFKARFGISPSEYGSGSGKKPAETDEKLNLDTLLKD